MLSPMLEEQYFVAVLLDSESQTLTASISGRASIPTPHDLLLSAIDRQGNQLDRPLLPSLLLHSRQ